MSSKYGVINEQGYPLGEFGFTPLTEQEEEKLKKSKDKDAKQDKDGSDD